MIATPMTMSEALGNLGNLPDAYQHEWRTATPQATIVVPGGVFKWYHLHRDGVEVPPELDAEARRLITDESPGWDLEYGLNFELLHQSTARVFLIIGVWRGHQELWTRIYGIDLAPGDMFQRVVASGNFYPSACVWELGVIQHERMAWHQYLFTERADADKRAWLEDMYSGTV